MDIQIIEGDCIESMRALPAKSVQTCVTSPPYFGLRNYGHDGQIGLETTPAAYVAKLVEVFAEVWRVLKDAGTLWLNLGDSFAANAGAQAEQTHTHKAGSQRGAWNGKTRRAPDGLKPKDLIGIPWRVAFALQDFGWYLRSDIIWHKPNPMPESVQDRPTRAHEYLFLMSKSERYFYDAKAIAEPAKEWFGRAATFERDGAVSTHVIPNQSAAQHRKNRKATASDGTRNKRDVWTVSTLPYKGAHFATFPPKLIEPCILAGSRPDDIVLDPFNGSGTTGAVAIEHGRSYIGLELNPDYIKLTNKRLGKVQFRLA